MYVAKKSAQDAKFGNLNRVEQRNKLFREARKLKSENQDIVGDKEDEGKLPRTEKDKLQAWRSHCQKLLNEEFPWDKDSFPDQPPTTGPPIFITKDMVNAALLKMKKAKPQGLLVLPLR